MYLSLASRTTTILVYTIDLHLPLAMPPSSSYLAMSSFSYQKLKKLPPPDPTQTHDLDQLQEAQHHHAVSLDVVVQDYYRQAAAAIVSRRRSRAPWRRRPSSSSYAGRRRRLRISGLARVLRRKAAAVGGRVRASVAKVVERLKEGGPYVGDLFAGNYMFLQVTPSAPAAAVARLDNDKGFLPYYYAAINKSKGSAAAVQGLIRS